PFARAGLETAYWDLCCARSGCSLIEAIGGRLARLGLPHDELEPRDRIACGVAVGIPDDESPSTLERWIAEHAAEGYRRVKIKIRPGWDVEPCRAARRACGDRFPLWTDANASFRLDRDLDVLRRLDDFGLLFHEQPLHHRDLLDHAKLARAIRTPICLDESLTSARAGAQALELEASRIWNVKVQRLGGLCEAIDVYRLAARSGVKLWGGTMPESGIGAQAIIALAAYPAFVFPSDVEPSRRWYAPGHDPVELVMDAEGCMAVGRARGIAEVIDRDRYERFGRDVERLRR
ncbi:MAG: o-succinylbenzoate synthase, partial [Planctomycetes bacterium]|nr:o-succinylbenzoate synthase [Planctomycetota bacterium]